MTATSTVHTHGTNGGYSRGCRCVPCTDAMTAYRANKGKCAVESCDRKVFARSLCRGHWQRDKDFGDVRADEPLRFSEPPPEKPKKSRGTASTVYNANGSTFSQTLTLEEWKRERAKADLVHVVVPGLAS